MAYPFERYLNVRNAYGASFGPEGDRLSFLMDTTGVPQVWSLGAPTEWPAQHTFYDERVTFASFSPDRTEVLFGMDEGGNERQQLFLLCPDGTVDPLTAHPEAKHRFGGWSHDGERFAFASNRRDGAVFDIYTQGRDERGEEAELIHEGDGWLTIGGWSPDDERLIVTESHSSFDQDVSVLDIDSGELTHLTPHEGRVRFQSPSWGPDGGIYLVTDEGADTLYLARLDAETGDLSVIERGGEWNVDGVALDEESERVVYSRNVDGYTELTVGALSGSGIEELPTPDLPKGIAGGVSFGPEGERFAVSATGDTHTTNVYVVECETGETERWTDAATGGIPPERFSGSELVRFESSSADGQRPSACGTESRAGREIPAFFSLPADAPAGGTPAIVDIHGGPEGQRRPSFSPVKQYFLDRGYAYFEPNVRGSSGYGREYTHLDDVEKRMDSVADIKAGVEWLHEQPAIDPDRIVALGGSYGGFMVLASLTEYPELWAAGIDIVGIANFVTFLENTGDWRRELREAEYGSLERDRDFLESVSPINNIDSIAAPLFVLHGENDPRVPVGEAEQIAETAAEHVPVETLIFDDEGHGFTKLENRIEAYTKIAAFLEEHV
ncbi:S9 family peptidase [Halalkalicoccus jeotgali]|uniref:Prolyl oligopeptidase family protein n=1 Tax=Halalkalicoccus jeotgali (strain DSM 18796 / CECT 7217 / JCM 14584 / KCTC 4019 / B3) TaxID=795797 RepID=D8J7V7_HALJB|nr:S9 family peptidase [Halalkalicoccus jeotgali]ADJ16127.1 prolyl oligopeptidase family protein [Halalkalicoccus jeotgali B3]ELY37556.1 prolyl oligopeptidase family protein [Halalkalicoccus jeotgali B3]